jgi:DNA-binding NtrC family response regulator
MSAKVLIVEDDDATRDGLRRLLAGAGYAPIVAASFPEGLRLLDGEKPDLLLVDVRLGEYNGLQLVIAAQRKVPAIVLTGHPDPVLAEDAHNEGADYLLKPVQPQRLLELMGRLLESAKERHA